MGPEVASGVMLASALVGGAATIAQSVGQSNAAKSQAAAQKANAQIQEQNARQRRDEAAARESLVRRDARKSLARQRAATSEAGLGLSGSSAALFSESAAAFELDALMARYEGDMAARGLLVDASFRRQQAAGLRSSANLSLATGLMGGAAQIIGGVANYGSSYTMPGGGSTHTTPGLRRSGFTSSGQPYSGRLTY